MAFNSRFTTILPLLFCWLFTYSQKANNFSISINYEIHNTNLSDVIEDLNEKYGLEFSFATESIMNIQLSAECRNLSLIEALDTIFEANNIEYQIIDEKILLRVKSLPENITYENESKSFIFSGKIMDQSTGQSLEFVDINIPYTKYGTSSKEDGFFELEIPNELISDTINLQLLGFKTQRIKLVESEGAIAVYQLDPSPITIEEITITHKKKSLEVNIFRNNIYINNQLKAGISNSPVGDDILKRIQLLPGVSAHDDISADIKIRGSNSDETLIIMDDIPLYNSSHFYGIFSAINSSYIDKINLYKNTFPISYGGKTGGVVELISSNEIKDKIHGEIDFNLLASSAILELPLGSKSKLRLSGRTTISDLTNSTFFKFSNQSAVDDAINNNHENLSRRILLNTDPKFNFQDINAKWVYEPNPANHINFNFYYSSDDFDNSYSNSFFGRKDDIKFNYIESFTNTEGWENLGFSAKHEWKKNGFSVRSLAYFTRYQNDATVGLELLRTSDQRPDHHFEFINSQENLVDDKSIDISITKKLNSFSEIRLGANAIHHKVNFNFNEEFISILEGDGSTTEFSQYINFSSSFSNTWFLDLGIRGSYYTEMEQYYLSPRINLTYLVNNNFSLKTSFGKYHQFLRELSQENRLGQNVQFWVLANEQGSLPVAGSTNYMFGATLKLGLFDIDIEYFNKNMDGIAEHVLIRPGFDEDSTPPNAREYQLFVGTGKTYGLDLMISKTTRHYQGWIAYTLSNATNSFEEIANGIDFSSQNHRKHQLKFINEFTVGNFNFGANYIFSSGRPYTDLSMILAATNIKDIDPNDRIKYLPDYQRVDFSVDYNFSIKGVKAKAGVSLFNAFNNENVKYVQYIYSVPTTNPSGQGFINNILGAQTPLLTRTVNLSFKLSF